MKVKYLMTRGAECAAPDCTIKDAAAKMKQYNIGALPVCDKDGIKGIVTDRDIVVRVTAHGGDPNRITVGEIMTRNPICCREDANIKDVAKMMENKKIRRVIVQDSSGEMTGVLSMDDFTKRQPGQEIVSEVLEAVAARHI